jgi:hypothetical protein
MRQWLEVPTGRSGPDAYRRHSFDFFAKLRGRRRLAGPLFGNPRPPFPYLTQEVRVP